MGPMPAIAFRSSIKLLSEDVIVELGDNAMEARVREHPPEQSDYGVCGGEIRWGIMCLQNPHERRVADRSARFGIGGVPGRKVTFGDMVGYHLVEHRRGG